MQKNDAANQLKILNDPVHGFIEVPTPFLLSVIDHPVIQRLRRIKQVGLSSLVYPGALHTRFSHALGAMHLTAQALQLLKRKGIEITDAEQEATLAAILLHDIGHGPFSHALENVLIPGVQHEKISRVLMSRLNQEFNGKLDVAIQIFEGTYPKTFLHQLVSSQLDMDRMDYLMRDSFFTGVHEGIVSAERIIKVLNVYDNQLVVEQKGLYSIEKFIVARRFMYWQVYLHKTALAAECMLIKILERAKELVQTQIEFDCDPDLSALLSIANNTVNSNLSESTVQHFLALDDFNIHYCLKLWQHSKDAVLRELANRIQNRVLFKLRFLKTPLSPTELKSLQHKCAASLGIDMANIHYFVFEGKASNMPYLQGTDEPILILHKDGTLEDITAASDMASMNMLTELATKHYICTPTAWA